MTRGGLERAARSLLARLDRAGLVTWEEREDGARLLMITNIWPHAERPALGPFVRDTVEGLRDLGIACDVLFIRGYRSRWAYLAGALAALLVPLAHPRKYALVHCHGGETALAGRFFLGVPAIASYLGTDLLGAQVGGGPVRRARCWLRSAVLRRHAVLMSGSTTKSAEMEGLLAERARRRNAVIPDGVDRDRFRPGHRAAARAELGWRAEAQIVLFAGRPEAVEKRLPLARAVAGLAASRVPAVELKVAEGIDPGRMPLCYAAADCLLHTSVSEGSPNVVKEALACDLPVVATPSGDVKELLHGVEECAVCEPDPVALADALTRILQAGSRSNGRDLTEHLDRAAIARRTADYYGRVGFRVPAERAAELSCVASPSRSRG